MKTITRPFPQNRSFFKGCTHYRWGKPLLLCSYLLAPHGGAQELFEPFAPVRPMGMGGASVATANDQNAIWSNPAGISRIRKARSRSAVHFLAFPSIVAGANSEGISFYSQLQNSSGSGTLANNIKSAIDSSSSQSSQKPIWGRLSANPKIIFEPTQDSPIAFSLFSNSRAKLTFVTDDGSESTQVEGITDVGGTIGISMTNQTNRLNFGIQVRPMIRYAYDDKIDITTLTQNKVMEDRIKADANHGTGIGIDLGFMWTFADFWFPTFGLAVFNLPTGCRDDYLNPFTELRQKICGTTYSGTINNPESLFLVDPTDIRAGISITPRLSNKMALRFAIDVHHLYFATGTTYYGLPGVEPVKQAHAGVELFFGNPLMLNPFSLRAGVNQGNLTLGATVRFSFIAIEYASYGKDISADPTSVEDRRSLLSLTAEL